MIEKHLYKISGAIFAAGLVAVFLAAQDARGQEATPQQGDQAAQNSATLPPPAPLDPANPPKCDKSLNLYCDLAPSKFVMDYVSPPPLYTWI